MQLAANGRCTNCGETLSGETGLCPACGAQVEEVARRPRGAFAILIALLVLGFAATGAMIQGYEARREQLAERWFRRGDDDLKRGAALQAVSEFQTALAYSPNADLYRTKLALALMKANKWDQARAHLLNLWETRPGDGNVNLLLARVFAQKNDIADAVRYYNGAIYGVWDSNPVENRRAARFEVAEFLLRNKQAQAAQSELIALSSEPSSSPADQLRLAQLMLNAGQPRQALDTFERVRRKDRNNFDANVGAAEASFQLDRFAAAHGFARDALRVNPTSIEASSIANQAEALIEADPHSPGLHTAERARRAFAAYKSADARLVNCLASKPGDFALQQLLTDEHSTYPRLKERDLRDQDLREELMQWVFKVETAAARTCGTPAGLDGTLLTLAQVQQKEQ